MTSVIVVVVVVAMVVAVLYIIGGAMSVLYILGCAMEEAERNEVMEADDGFGAHNLVWPPLSPAEKVFAGLGITLLLITVYVICGVIMVRDTLSKNTRGGAP